MGTRKRTPKNVERDVLVKSARRCCLCYGLRGDFSVKSGQIAHVDRDSTNSVLDNLVFLCLDHHDMYDSTTRQSKSITKVELLYYWKVLCVDVVEHLPRLSSEYEEDQQKRLSEFIARIRKRSAFPSPLLNGYEIESAVKEGILSIDPFTKERLHLSAYGLHLGKETIIGQTLATLSPVVSLTLEPGELATISTDQIVSLPFGLVGRILPMHLLSHDGLFITNAGTIDPGFRGRLFLVIANKGTLDVEMHVGTEIAKIEFMLFNMPPRGWEPGSRYHLPFF